MPQPYKVFTIYAREDAQYLKELRGQLRPLEIGGRIKVWSDSEINPGLDWENEIVQNLDTADIILILVSAAYYDSAYIHEKEINYAIMRHERGEAKVLPIIVRPCSFGDDPIISRLQVLPTDGKPVNDRRHWHERDDAWLDVVAGVKRTIDLLRESEHNREQEISAARKQEEDVAFAAKQEAERKRLEAEKEKELVRQAEKLQIELLKQSQSSEVKGVTEKKVEVEQNVLQQKIEEAKNEQVERIVQKTEARKNENEHHGQIRKKQQKESIIRNTLFGILVVLLAIWLVTKVLNFKSVDRGEKTRNGNYVLFHTKNQGPKVREGETVLINVNTWVNDSLVQSTFRDTGGPREIVLPDSILMKGKVPAVFDALLLMAKGDSVTVLQPTDSIMKLGIPKSFGEVQEIRFEVKLVDILTPNVIQKRELEKKKKDEGQVTLISETVKTKIAEYKGKTLRNFRKSKSGLEYIIIEKGIGKPVKDGDTVPTNYYGVRMSDGIMFDNSYDRGGPSSFTVGELIPGFNEGMMLINRGGKAILFIPSQLAYGKEGGGADIPPNTDLVFYVEIED